MTITDWQRRTWRPVYDGPGQPVAYKALRGGIFGPLQRPPLGGPIAGPRATAAGRGRRRYVDDQAKGERRRLAFQAWTLRIGYGRTISEIAAALGIGRTTIGKWLQGCPAEVGYDPAKLLFGDHPDVAAELPWARCPGCQAASAAQYLSTTHHPDEEQRGHAVTSGGQEHDAR